MKKFLFVLVLVSLMLTACALKSAPVAQAPTQTPWVITATSFQPVAATSTPVVVLPAQPAMPTITTQPVAPAPVIGDLYQSPVQTTDTFNGESAWMIAEPGVILDDSAVWTIPSTKEIWYVNVPEGGFTYFSIGEGVITIDGVKLSLAGENGLNYLMVLRGRIDDNIVDSDLNETAKVADFVPGHAIWSIMPPGAYVSKGWFRQQLVTSTTTGGTNCGATGCSKVIVVLFDINSHTQQRYEIQAEDLDNWTLVN